MTKQKLIVLNEVPQLEPWSSEPHHAMLNSVARLSPRNGGIRLYVHGACPRTEEDKGGWEAVVSFTDKDGVRQKKVATILFRGFMGGFFVQLDNICGVKGRDVWLT